VVRFVAMLTAAYDPKRTIEADKRHGGR
jgi:hypothetical protein